ncbi:helix-turn-helix domain-containing protein [Streptomyces sp. NBC_01317]|uniref:ArsR/SmtB family transcription factor n=1 Tax=Streptomyces sp. NBC_01317 TaxID=2903822 RepID=UPI002E1249BB|nr:helix-turn-helix domain-containing protein [Streptomyces sp. NBC_01317]
MADEFGHPAPGEMDLGKVLAALADPLRRGVVTALLREPDGTERTCASFQLPVSKSSCTYHFRVLRESGLILHPDYGNRRGVTLRRAELEQRFPGLLGVLAHDALAVGATA